MASKSHFSVAFCVKKYVNFSIVSKSNFVKDITAYCYGNYPLRECLRTHTVFTKDHSFYLNYHKFSIKSYVLDVY